DSTRDVCLSILDPIDVPFDRSSGTRDRIRVESSRKRAGRIVNSSERGMVAIPIGPVNRAEVFSRVLALNLHDVDLAAGGPANRTDAVAEHPESRPDSL